MKYNLYFYILKVLLVVFYYFEHLNLTAKLYYFYFQNLGKRRIRFLPGTKGHQECYSTILFWFLELTSPSCFFVLCTLNWWSIGWSQRRQHANTVAWTRKPSATETVMNAGDVLEGMMPTKMILSENDHIFFHENV